MQKKQKGIVWFKNDLRIADNPALQKAIAENESVVGVHCFDPKQYATTAFGFKKTAHFRAQFTIESVQELRANLASLGITLLVYHDSAAQVIPTLIDSSIQTTIYFQNEWTSEEKVEIDSLKKNCGSTVEFVATYHQFLYPPEVIPFAIAEIPAVFTQFRNACEKKAVVPKIGKLTVLPESNTIDIQTTIPTLEDLGFTTFQEDRRTAFPFRGGENQALARLQEYLWNTKKISQYKQTRNGLIGKDYSSKFSPWLANGCLSPRTIYWEIKRYEKEVEANESTYWLIFELLWRDYFKYISLQNGNAIFKIGGIQNRDYQWSQDNKAIQQWINGTTAEPFVNANMLELQQTGWMSNRGRQNVASYFAKTLLLDWRIGAAYFESMLLDYDVHSNYGNWMYVSGVGNDPRDRKFNVALQAQNYDKQSKFQQRWLQQQLF
ncbi:MAG: DASH family cryptochrome [Flavobacterium sp.]